MTEIKFTETHEWIRIADDGTAMVGITTYARDQLGELVYVELPEVGKTLKLGDEAVVIESVKAAGDVKAPVNGVIVEVNTALATEPGKVNEDPMGEGWFFKMKISDPAQLKQLMDEAGYRDLIKK